MASFRESTTPGAEAVAPPQWLMDAALTRLHEGSLPRELMSKVLAGPGRGQVCSLCDHAIERGDVGYEVAPGSDTEPDLHLHFHVCCYRAWVKACNSMPRAYRRASSVQSPYPDPKRSGP